MLRRTAPAVLATLVCALGLFATSAATWVDASVNTTLQQVAVPVKGSDAATVVTALGLVAAAAALASTLAGRVLRSVVGVVVSLAGIGSALAAVAVVSDPAGASRSTVGDQTGVVGAGGQFALTAWPWVAVVAAVALALCGIWLVVVAQHVRPRAPKRYDRTATEQGGPGEDRAATDEIDAWDALSRGEDPTR